MKSYREAAIKCENHQWRVVSVSSKRNVYTEELIGMIEIGAVLDLEAQLKIAIEALERYSDKTNFEYFWDDDRNPRRMDLFEIRGEYSIADFNVLAVETLDKINKMKGT
jgi:hypothetical protein